MERLQRAFILEFAKPAFCALLSLGHRAASVKMGSKPPFAALVMSDRCADGADKGVA